jgi:hypothetical protein
MPGGQDAAPGTRVAAIADETGTVHVFARWNDGSLRFTRRVGGGTAWAAWQNLGGSISSEPAVGANLDTRLEVFARGADLTLVHRWEPTF